MKWVSFGLKRTFHFMHSTNKSSLPFYRVLQVWPHTSSELERRHCSNTVTAGFVLHDELGKWLTWVNSWRLQLHRADPLALGRCLHVSYSYLEVLTSKSFYVLVPFLYLICFDWCPRDSKTWGTKQAKGPQYTHTATVQLLNHLPEIHFWYKMVPLRLHSVCSMYACVHCVSNHFPYLCSDLDIRIQVNFLASIKCLHRFVMFWGPTAVPKHGETVNVLKLIKDMLAQWESLLSFSE